ncbi:hypothetical protein RMSM_04744 [Rhodopirellula maiorica SM1]|uniref:Uncharacterized protein n=1 Tax=Rhodopirellula maiorica SM1 TaxID=1265738 RepID=M5RGS0_9BACT|nr:hypothetical protein RMSM_04744 [Rhodopirellula maiorica SM1]
MSGTATKAQAAERGDVRIVVAIEGSAHEKRLASTIRGKPFENSIL